MIATQEYSIKYCTAQDFTERVYGKLAERTIKSDRKSVGVFVALIGLALLIAAGISSALPMKTNAYDCGTFWAADDTWTYASSYPGADAYFDSGIDPYDSVQAGVDDLMADLDTGAAAYDACKERHSDRAVLIYAISEGGVVLPLFGAGVWVSGRRRARTDISSVHVKG